MSLDFLKTSESPYHITPYKKEGIWYLSVKYFEHSDDGEYQITFPKIKLGNCKLENMRQDVSPLSCCRPSLYVDLGFGELEALCDDAAIYTIKTIRRNMTIKDIEEALGYKINIVNDKGESV